MVLRWPPPSFQESHDKVINVRHTSLDESFEQQIDHRVVDSVRNQAVHPIMHILLRRCNDVVHRPIQQDALRMIRDPESLLELLEVS